MNERNQLIEEFKGYVMPTPALQHPWFQGIIKGEFSRDEIIRGEQQHYLRNRLNAVSHAAIVARATLEGDDDVIASAIENFREEVCGPETHGDLMYQFLKEQGISKEDAARTEPMPGMMAAVAMITQSIHHLSALEGIALWSLAEWENGGSDGVAAQVYNAYVGFYGFSEHASETYRTHAVVDIGHGDGQLDLLAKKVIERPELKQGVVRALKFGHAAFTYQWDGHYQAATGQPHFHWRGTES